MKKYLIKDLPKGPVVITKEQLLEIRQGGGGSNINNSYSTSETLTGGTWIDSKPIYAITQLTGDAPPTADTTIKSTVVDGTYTEYEYTKIAE